MNYKLESLDLRGFLFILRKNIKMLIIMTIIFGLVGYSVSKFLIKPQYQSTATLIVNASTQSQDMSQTYDAVQVSQMLVDTYTIILESDTVLDKVDNDLQLGLTTQQLKKKIDVKGEGTTEVIDLSVKDESPATAAAIANDILKFAPSEIMRTVKAGSVEVISKARPLNKPVSPNIPLFTLIGAFAGLFLALIIAFMKEMLNNTFESDEDIQKYLDFTLLGVIPNINSNK